MSLTTNQLVKLRTMCKYRKGNDQQINVRFGRYTDSNFSLFKGKSTAYTTHVIALEHFRRDALNIYRGPDLVRFGTKLPPPELIPADLTDPFMTALREPGLRKGLIDSGYEQIISRPPHCLEVRGKGNEEWMRAEVLYRRRSFYLDSLKKGQHGIYIYIYTSYPKCVNQYKALLIVLDIHRPRYRFIAAREGPHRRSG